MMAHIKKELFLFCCFLFLYSPSDIRGQEMSFKGCSYSPLSKTNFIHDCTNGFKYPSYNADEYKKLIKAIQSSELVLKAYKDSLITKVDLKLNSRFINDVIFICSLHMNIESHSAKLRFYLLLVKPILPK